MIAKQSPIPSARAGLTSGAALVAIAILNHDVVLRARLVSWRAKRLAGFSAHLDTCDMAGAGAFRRRLASIAGSERLAAHAFGFHAVDHRLTETPAPRQVSSSIFVVEPQRRRGARSQAPRIELYPAVCDPTKTGSIIFCFAPRRAFGHGA